MKKKKKKIQWANIIGDLRKILGLKDPRAREIKDIDGNFKHKPVGKR